MKRDDKLLLSLTFLTGLAIGMYVYIGVFKPMYAAEDLSDTETEANEWSLIARRYGGDRLAGYSDPTFRLLGDGSYTYFPAAAETMDVVPREGTLSRALMRQLRAYDNDLMRYSYTVNDSDCASYVDGLDYEYRFTKNSILFTLDTCTTALQDDTPLASVLTEVWNEIEGRGIGNQGGNFSDWAEGWINENLGANTTENTAR